jgi:hypothetical protein
LHKVSFGAMAKKKEEARTSYPVLPDPNGQLAVMAARIIERTAQIDALDGALSLDKAELKTLATPFYFAQANGKVEVASSINVLSPGGGRCSLARSSLLEGVWLRKCLRIKDGLAKVCSQFPTLLSP